MKEELLEQKKQEPNAKYVSYIDHVFMRAKIWEISSTIKPKTIIISHYLFDPQHSYSYMRPSLYKSVAWSVVFPSVSPFLDLSRFACKIQDSSAMQYDNGKARHREYNRLSEWQDDHTSSTCERRVEAGCEDWQWSFHPKVRPLQLRHTIWRYFISTLALNKRVIGEKVSGMHLPYYHRGYALDVMIDRLCWARCECSCSFRNQILPILDHIHKMRSVYLPATEEDHYSLRGMFDCSGSRRDVQWHLWINRSWLPQL